jgi:hypothetical protein
LREISFHDRWLVVSCQRRPIQDTRWHSHFVPRRSYFALAINSTSPAVRLLLSKHCQLPW